MTRSYWFTIGYVFVMAASFVHAGGEAKGKAKVKLEGTWVAEVQGNKIEMIFRKGGTFSVLHPAEGKLVKGTYKVDATKKPVYLDMKIKEGFGGAEGKTALCIIEVTGNTLKWHANDPVQGNPRPTSFPEKPPAKGNYIYLIFKRAGGKPANGTKKAATEIQGTWTVVSMLDPDGDKENIPKNSKFIISRNKFTIVEGNKTRAQFAYKLYPDRNPKWIDLLFNGEPLLGIYRLEENKLTICNSNTKGAKRPTEFEPNRELAAGVTVLRRLDSDF